MKADGDYQKNSVQTLIYFLLKNVCGFNVPPCQPYAIFEMYGFFLFDNISITIVQHFFKLNQSNKEITILVKDRMQ